MRFLTLASLLMLLPLSANARDWQVDAAKSSLTFKGVYQGGPFEGRFAKFDATIAFDDAAEISFTTHTVGTLLDVTWNRKTYEAKVIQVDDGFQLITYPGFPPRWDEWITSSRVVGLHEPGRVAKRLRVLSGGKRYDAILLTRKGTEYCVHYVGYSDGWDECVSKDRVAVEP